MIQVKNKLHFLPLFLISFLTIFFVMNINPVMAMNPNNPETSNQGSSSNNLTLEEKIINLKTKICENAAKKTQISREIQELVNNDDRKADLLRLKDNYTQLIENQKEQLKTCQTLLKNLNDDDNN
ncbi:MAG: effector protein [Vigna little leaf phytoplasma]|nr:effector protein [Vigna little leaf phytoplasma]